MGKPRTTYSKISLDDETKQQVYELAADAADYDDPTFWLISHLQNEGFTTRKQCGFAAGVLYALKRGQ